jgi:hypothetical protein
MKGGTIRRIANTFKRLMGRPITTTYKDPLPLRGDPALVKKPGRYRRRKNDTRPMMKRGNLGPPPCDPGTITYHDKLVRHFGARKARKLGKMMRLQPDLVVTEEDFLAHPPWAHLRRDSGTGSRGILSDG